MISTKHLHPQYLISQPKLIGILLAKESVYNCDEKMEHANDESP
jgi:hypothetical protein